MKVTLSFDWPLNRKQRITRTFELPDGYNDVIKLLMEKSGNGSMIILPVEVDVQYKDGSKETTTVFISTLSGKCNRVINKLTEPEVASEVIVNEVQKSFMQRFKDICLGRKTK